MSYLLTLRHVVTIKGCIANKMAISVV